MELEFWEKGLKMESTPAVDFTFFNVWQTTQGLLLMHTVPHCLPILLLLLQLVLRLYFNRFLPDATSVISGHFVRLHEANHQSHNPLAIVPPFLRYLQLNCSTIPFLLHKLIERLSFLLPPNVIAPVTHPMSEVFLIPIIRTYLHPH